MNMSNHERGDDITSLYVVQKSWFWKDLEFFSNWFIMVLITPEIKNFFYEHPMSKNGRRLKIENVGCGRAIIQCLMNTSCIHMSIMRYAIFSYNNHHNHFLHNIFF